MAEPQTSGLRDKLGLKPGQRAAIIRLPEAVKTELGDTSDIAPLSRVVGMPFNFVLYFVTSREQLEAVMPNLVYHLHSSGMLWLAWTKRTSPLHHGLGEDLIRKAGLGAGLVDVKVASLSSDWSGLKFMHRNENRK